MKRNKRLALAVIALCLLAAAAFIFRDFLFSSLLLPLALSFWFLLRLLVFSIHQAVIWYLIIGVICLYFVSRYLMERPTSFPAEPYLSENLHMGKLTDLDRLIRFSSQGESYRKKLKEELRKMLVSLYAAEKRESVTYVIYDRFARGEIELPGDIYRFLFQEEEKTSGLFSWFSMHKAKERRDREFPIGMERCLTYLEERMELTYETDRDDLPWGDCGFIEQDHR